jgi:hypothetical protein
MYCHWPGYTMVGQHLANQPPSRERGKGDELRSMLSLQQRINAGWQLAHAFPITSTFIHRYPTLTIKAPAWIATIPTQT